MCTCVYDMSVCVHSHAQTPHAQTPRTTRTSQERTILFFATIKKVVDGAKNDPDFFDFSMEAERRKLKRGSVPTDHARVDQTEQRRGDPDPERWQTEAKDPRHTHCLHLRWRGIGSGAPGIN
mgnify:CR=1 FL=1